MRKNILDPISKIAWIPIVLISFMIISCKKDSVELGSLEIVFKVEYDGVPLVMFEPHDYAVEQSIFFTRFSFFLSEISIKGEREQQLSEIEYFDLTSSHLDAASAVRGTSWLIDKIPVGVYDRMEFALGVKQDLNAKTPAEYPPDHPLSDAGEYWSGWKSYIFHKTEGKLDTDDDDVFELALALHVGSDAAFRKKIITGEFNIRAGKIATHTIIIDLHDMLFNSQNPYDLIKTPQIHALEQIDFVNQLADNLVDAIR